MKTCLCGETIHHFEPYPPDPADRRPDKFGIVGFRPDGLSCCSAMGGWFSTRETAQIMCDDFNAREYVDLAEELGLERDDRSPAELEAEYAVDSDPYDREPMEY